MKVDEDNGKYFEMVNLRACTFRLFLSNGFWKNVGCLISDPTFGIGVLRL